MKKRSILNKLKESKGSTSLVFVCSVVLIVILSALVTDIGYVAYERYSLSRNVDSIVMSGAQTLADSREECIVSIKRKVSGRIKGVSEMDIRISDNNREITLLVKKNIGYIFLRYVGFKDKQIESRVTAKLSNVTSYTGISPVAVESAELSFGDKCKLTNSDIEKSKENDEPVLKIIPIDTQDESFKTSFIYGYRKKVHLGMNLNAVSGGSLNIDENSVDELINKCRHEPLCSYDNYTLGCPRIIILPVVEKEDSSLDGAMKVVGFTAFFVERGNVVKGLKDTITLEGRFIRYTVKASTSDGMPDFGLLGVKLVH